MVNFTKYIIAILFVLHFAGCTTLVQVPVVANTPIQKAQEVRQGFANVLATHVNDQGEVDFQALRDDPSENGLSSLENYVRFIETTSIDGFSNPNDRLAHLINSYNALSMYNVIALGIPRGHFGYEKIKFFLLRQFLIGGQNLSLYGFENKIIRPLNEPRIHFSLNCSAVSCPQLPRVLFVGSVLDSQLEQETRRFFARPENLRIDHSKKVIHLNEILKFYTEDFVPAHAKNLIEYAQRYTDQALPKDYAVKFIPYDWTIANSRKK